MLSRVSPQQLKNIKVVIRRPFLTEVTTSTTIQTSVDDPSKIPIHRKGEGERPIFSRKGIKVNQEEHLEERIVSTSPTHDAEEQNSRRSPSGSHSDRDSYRRSYSRSPSKESRASKSTPKKGKAKIDSSNKKDYVEKSVRRQIDYQRRESHRSGYKEFSPKPGTSNSNRTPVKEAHRNDCYKRDYHESPKHFRSRSNTPKRSSYNKLSVHEREKQSRRYSRSPSSRRRSRSPYNKKRTPSPYVKRHSRSPYNRRTSPIKPTRRSRSPYDKSKKYGSGYRPSHKRRTPSPYTRKRSRSPYRSRKRSLTPPHRDRHSGRPRSKSPHSHKHSSLAQKRDTDGIDYDGMHADFSYYGAEGGYWVPAPIPRPGFIPRGLVPPMAMPRGIFRPPYMMPRPYMPIPHAHFRPRMPMGYYRPTRPKVTTASVTTATVTSSSTVITVSAPPTTSTPSIEEVVSDTEKADSNPSAKD